MVWEKWMGVREVGGEGRGGMVRSLVINRLEMLPRHCCKCCVGERLCVTWEL